MSGVEFVEIVVDRPINVDRDDIEDALNEALSGIGEVTGAGVSIVGSNLDVEVDPNADRHGTLAIIFEVLRQIGLGDSVRVRPGDGDIWIRESQWKP